MKAKIYSRDNCIFCTKAIDLLEQANIKYDEFKIGRDLTREEFFELMPEGTKTVPQIFLDGNHIGGYDALLVQFSD